MPRDRWCDCGGDYERFFDSNRDIFIDICLRCGKEKEFKPILA